MSELNIVVVLHAKKGREQELRKDLAPLVTLSRKEQREKHHTQSEHTTHFHAGGVASIEKTEAAYFLDRVVV